MYLILSFTGAVHPLPGSMLAIHIAVLSVGSTSNMRTYTIDNLNKQCGEPMCKEFLPRCIDHYVVATVGLCLTNTQTLVRRVSRIQKTAENVVDVILPTNQPQCDPNQHLRPRSSLSTSAASNEITYLTRSSDPGEIRPVQESFKHGDQSIRVT